MMITSKRSLILILIAYLLASIYASNANDIDKDMTAQNDFGKNNVIPEFIDNVEHFHLQHLKIQQLSDVINSKLKLDVNKYPPEGLFLYLSSSIETERAACYYLLSRYRNLSADLVKKLIERLLPTIKEENMFIKKFYVIRMFSSLTEFFKKTDLTDVIMSKTESMLLDCKIEEYDAILMLANDKKYLEKHQNLIFKLLSSEIDIVEKMQLVSFLFSTDINREYAVNKILQLIENEKIGLYNELLEKLICSNKYHNNVVLKKGLEHILKESNADLASSIKLAQMAMSFKKPDYNFIENVLLQNIVDTSLTRITLKAAQKLGPNGKRLLPILNQLMADDKTSSILQYRMTISAIKGGIE